MGPRYEQENPGVSDAYLEGNIGTSQEIQPFNPPPAPPLVASNPNGEVVAQAKVVGGDPIGVPLTVTIRVRAPSALLAGSEALKVVIEWGSGGFQPASAQFDVRHSQVVQVHGSWVRVKMINSSTGVINMAAFITIGSRPPNTDPVLTETFVLGIGATIDISIPEFAKYVQVFTDDPLVDAYDVAFRAAAIDAYAVNVAAGVSGTEKIPVSSIADVVRITNTGAGAIGRGIVFFGMQF